MVLSKNGTVLLYIFVFFISMVLVYSDFIIKDKTVLKIKAGHVFWKLDYKKIFFVLAPLPLVTLSFMRKNVGTDYSGYLDYYYIIQQNMNIELEYLYKVINIISEKIFHEFYGVLLISAFITNYFIFYGMKKYLNRYCICGVFSYMLLYYLSTYNGVRQWISVSIIFWAYHYIETEEKWKYVIACIIASLFHQTAIVCVLFYFVKYLKFNRFSPKKFLYYGALVFSPLYMPAMISIVTRVFLSQYLGYLSGNFYGGVGFLKDYLVILIIIGAVEFNIIQLQDYSKYEMFKNIFLFTILFRSAGYVNVTIARLAWYTEICQIVIIFLIVQNSKKKIYKYGAGSIAMLQYIYYFWQVYYLNNSSEVFPYTFNIF